jgi:hypothetical protein
MHWRGVDKVNYKLKPRLSFYLLQLRNLFDFPALLPSLLLGLRGIKIHTFLLINLPLHGTYRRHDNGRLEMSNRLLYYCWYLASG